jgi:glutathione S-transferase
LHASASNLGEIHGPPLHPSDPLTKARHRGWIEVGASILADIWTLETTHDREAFDARVRALKDKFGRIDVELRSGPYFTGERFCIVDSVFAPVFRYFDVFDGVCDLGVLAQTPQVRAWRAALAQRPSVKGAVVADYPDRLRAFLRRHAGVITQLSVAA